jgi:dolichyl-diphosphooligosaccharide--protein glycosyltransferase
MHPLFISGLPDLQAWWDYGYQISGIAERTTLADGNTWSLEHIALIGLGLTSPVPESHAITRHLADYVLVWAGGGSDDLAKSPHMARIANSVCVASLQRLYIYI